MVLSAHAAYDVVVVGGGPAGIGAAVAAARNGARTLLVEQAPFLGGCLTMDLAFHIFYDQRGHKVVHGIPQEIVDRVVALGGSPGHVESRGTTMRSYTVIDPEILKFVAQEMVLEAGAELLLHAFATDALMDGNGIAGIIVQGKGGQEAIPARVVVDCSGDGDIAAWTGAPFQKGRDRDGRMQAVTLMFRLAHVDTELLPQYFTGSVTYATKPGHQTPTFLRAEGHFDQWADAWREEGLLDTPHHFVALSSLRDGELKMNTTRVVGIDGTDTWDLTKAEIEGRRQVMAIHRFLKKNVPGFANSAIIATGPFIGVRETRRISGEYTLTEEDVLHGRDFPDNIARNAYFLDLHDPDGTGIHGQHIEGGRSCGVPYRILLPMRIEQLLVAGRCVSATHEALASIRVMATCMAMGQAAGAAAALSVRDGRLPRELDVTALRDLLRQQGVVLEDSDSPSQFETPAGLSLLQGRFEL